MTSEMAVVTTSCLPCCLLVAFHRFRTPAARTQDLRSYNLNDLARYVQEGWGRVSKVAILTGLRRSALALKHSVPTC